jgi:hypothetical protein
MLDDIVNEACEQIISFIVLCDFEHIPFNNECHKVSV